MALVVFAASFVLLAVITIERWFKQRRRKKNAAFEREALPVLRAFSEGRAKEEAVIKVLLKNRSEAMNILILFAHGMEPELRPKLAPIFEKLVVLGEEVLAIEQGQVKRRLMAAERLGFLSNDASAAALVKALDDEAPVVRLCAARSLSIQGRTDAIKPILRALDLPAELDHRREVETLSGYGESAVPALLSVIESSRRKYSSNAIVAASRALGMLKAEEAVQPLIKLLQHPRDGVRLCAARALGDIGDPVAISPVAALADDPSWRVRRRAVKAMGKLNADEQVPKLSEALGDSSWWVRFAAAQALYSFGSSGISELERVQRTSSDKNARGICSEVLEEHAVLDTN
ncbi:HEAT repeat domain-containing protein [Rubritalea tangerina]|uniref:HEAT repeat domain-containing protein n=1 Tax=Rubritalea tangerina TaxID=430798 RepID=A0ABW4ZEJ5_9BACT